MTSWFVLVWGTSHSVSKVMTIRFTVCSSSSRSWRWACRTRCIFPCGQRPIICHFSRSLSYEQIEKQDINAFPIEIFPSSNCAILP